MNGVPEGVSNINLIYLIFVFDTAVSYFNSYYRTLLISDQKKYKDISIQAGVMLVISITQIIIIYTTRNYLLYLARTSYRNNYNKFISINGSKKRISIS